MRVLLVDDEKELVATLAERLSIRGIEADWALDADSALSQARQHCYDLAVLDVVMPGLGGIRLKKLLEKVCPGMKYIFLTGHGSESDYQAGAEEAGSDYYLIKPVPLDRLIAKMREALDQ